MRMQAVTLIVAGLIMVAGCSLGQLAEQLFGGTNSNQAALNKINPNNAMNPLP